MAKIDLNAVGDENFKRYHEKKYVPVRLKEKKYVPVPQSNLCFNVI